MSLEDKIHRKNQETIGPNPIEDQNISVYSFEIIVVQTMKVQCVDDYPFRSIHIHPFYLVIGLHMQRKLGKN